MSGPRSVANANPPMHSSSLARLVEFPPDILFSALAWVQQSGWPGRADDLALAAHLWGDHVTGNAVTKERIRLLLEALDLALSGADAQAAHRRVLIRVTWYAAAEVRRR